MGRTNIEEAWPLCVLEEWVASICAAVVDVGFGPRRAGGTPPVDDMEERLGGRAWAPLLRGPKRMLVENPKALPVGIDDGDGSGSSIGNEGGGG